MLCLGEQGEDKAACFAWQPDLAKFHFWTFLHEEMSHTSVL